MKAAIYARTSTASRQDVESQLEVCRLKAGPGAPEFVDRAISSSRESRAGIDALLTAAAHGEFDRVYIVELSRLGRSLGFITRTVEDLAGHGVKVVLARTGTTIDPSTLEGRALLGGLALAADIEMALIRDRNARGRETIRRRGVRTGPKPKAVSEAAIRALSERGLSQDRIARELGVSKATVNRRCKTLGIRTEVKRHVPPEGGQS